MKVLVTGGTGFLGETLVRALSERGVDEIVVIARSDAPALAALERVELVAGDILDGPALERCLRGVDGVYHLAGFVSRDPDDAQRMRRVHVDGTRRVLELAHAAGLRRVVVASTSGTVAVSADDETLDESAGYAEEVVAGWPYYATKIYQEKLAFELGDKLGIEVVCVNPSLLLGPGDRRQSSTGDVKKFIDGRIPFVPPGGVNFVDVRDAADATITAMAKGRAGHRYLLGGPNWTFKEFFGRLSRAAKKSPPRVPALGGLAKWGASVIEHAYRSRGRTPPVDRISVEMSEHFWYVDAGKAERELAFVARDPALTLVDTVHYLNSGVAKRR